MEDKDIIKALERCGQHRECCYCNSVEECGSKRVLTASALDLINRQKAEVADLTYKIWGIMHSVDKWLEGDELKQDEVNRAITMREKTLQITEKQQAEIERLQEQIGSLNKKYPCTVDVGDNCLVYARSLDDYDSLIGNISAEGIKEFWQKMKTIIDDSRYKVITHTHYARGCNDVIDYCLITGDNLVKEMTEQKEWIN